MELQVIMGVVGILSLLSNVIGGMALYILRGIRRSQERLWERLDQHVEDDNAHSLGRVVTVVERNTARLDRLLNGRTGT